jgi:hypothetical protein
MALPGMDLQSQYAQTLQDTIGKSQSERLRDMRRNQTTANTDWSQRQVGEGAKRFSGFQEVNPSEMPNLSGDVQSFIKPFTGQYDEGGRTVHGYYGDVNPYTIPNLQDVVTGMNVYNNASGDTAAQQSKQINDLYSKVTSSTSDWQSRYGPAKQSIEQYTKYGFTPGKDNGSWRWQSHNPLLIQGQRDELGNLYDPNYEQTAYTDHPYEKDSGYWLNDNGQFEGVNYSPSAGFWKSDFDHAPKGMGKIMPAITMAALAAMTGGAGAAMMAPEGAAAGAALTGGQIAGQAIGSAIPGTLRTGFTTGDWGNALGQGVLSAAGSGLAGLYGPDLAKLSGMNPTLAKGIISSGVNVAGKLAQGKDPDWIGTIGNLGAGYLGNMVGSNYGQIAGGLTKGSLSGLVSALRNGSKSTDAAKRAVVGGITNLASLFDNEGGKSKWQQNNPKD